jgi:hypothetical protein
MYTQNMFNIESEIQPALFGPNAAAQIASLDKG